MKKSAICWRLFWLLITIVVVIFTVNSCFEQHDKSMVRNRNYKRDTACWLIARGTWYVYDERYDICYAITSPTTQYRTITVVPYENVKDVALMIPKE